MNLLGLSLMAFLVMGLMAFAIAGLFLWLGARLAGVEEVKFLKCMLAAFLGSIGFIALFWIPILGWLASLGIYIVIIKLLLDTEYTKALLAWLISVAATIGVSFVATLILASFGVSSTGPTS